MTYKVWYEKYINGRKSGSGVLHQEYKYTGFYY